MSYPNIGASQLAKVCEKFNIYDYRRDQLGTGFEATHTGSTVTGVAATRLDSSILEPGHEFYSRHFTKCRYREDSEKIGEQCQYNCKNELDE